MTHPRTVHLTKGRQTSGKEGRTQAVPSATALIVPNKRPATASPRADVPAKSTTVPRYRYIMLRDRHSVHRVRLRPIPRSSEADGPLEYEPQYPHTKIILHTAAPDHARLPCPPQNNRITLYRRRRKAFFSSLLMLAAMSLMLQSTVNLIKPLH